jgi:hypothetical protein
LNGGSDGHSNADDLPGAVRASWLMPFYFFF